MFYHSALGSVNMLFTFAIWILLKLHVVQSISALQLKLFSPKSHMTQVPTSLAIWNLAFFFFFFWQHWLTILPFFSITSGGFVLLLHTFLYTLQTTFFHLKHKLLFLSLLHSPHTHTHTNTLPPPQSFATSCVFSSIQIKISASLWHQPVDVWLSAHVQRH